MKNNDRIHKLLIANRGEIAVRVLRACRELGIHTIGVYSECDRLSPHVLWADEAHLLGPSPANESYLNADKILRIAKESGADAIHPGYGFLSENSEFSDACDREGMRFVGPRGESMRALGDKIRARQVAVKLGIPVVPGMEQPLQSLAEAERVADSIGYPVLVKASAGGGGRGMQVAYRREDLESAIRCARSEAEQSFKDSTIFLEKYILGPHHVEVQVLADRHGNVTTLGERECSVQRRHQKVIEETPSPFITEDTREKLMDASVRLAKEVGYENAGTMEFLVDQNQDFYFLEMNARLQVEHPITEMRTGIDLVRAQLKIAMDFPLDRIIGGAVHFRDHVVECRIYAEDPDNHFYPSPGKISKLHNPAGPGIRVDSAVSAGSEISIYYDAMIAKLIAWGPTRKKALQKMSRALKEYEIQGLKTNLPFLQNILSHPNFRDGRYDTGFIPNHLDELLKRQQHQEEIVAAIAAFLHNEKEIKQRVPTVQYHGSGIAPWKMLSRREVLR